MAISALEAAQEIFEAVKDLNPSKDFNAIAKAFSEKLEGVLDTVYDQVVIAPRKSEDKKTKQFEIIVVHRNTPVNIPFRMIHVEFNDGIVVEEAQVQMDGCCYNPQNNGHHGDAICGFIDTVTKTINAQLPESSRPNKALTCG